jgi:hypothetical protein
VPPGLVTHIAQPDQAGVQREIPLLQVLRQRVNELLRSQGSGVHWVSSLRAGKYLVLPVVDAPGDASVDVESVDLKGGECSGSVGKKLSTT